MPGASARTSYEPTPRTPPQALGSRIVNRIQDNFANWLLAHWLTGSCTFLQRITDTYSVLNDYYKWADTFTRALSLVVLVTALPRSHYMPCQMYVSFVIRTNLYVPIGLRKQQLVTSSLSWTGGRSPLILQLAVFIPSYKVVLLCT